MVPAAWSTGCLRVDRRAALQQRRASPGCCAAVYIALATAFHMAKVLHTSARHAVHTSHITRTQLSPVPHHPCHITCATSPVPHHPCHITRATRTTPQELLSTELPATTRYSPQQVRALEELQQRYPGQFLGPLAHLLYVTSDTYRAQDVLRLLSACYREDLDLLLVTDLEVQKEVERRRELQGSIVMRLDHIREAWHKQHRMPHEWVAGRDVKGACCAVLCCAVLCCAVCGAAGLLGCLMSQLVGVGGLGGGDAVEALRCHCMHASTLCDNLLTSLYPCTHAPMHPCG
jgi:hypothetical protein